MTISKTAVKTLMDLWVGEMVVIHLKGINLVIHEDENKSIEVAPMIQGFCYDIDSSFWHLGEDIESGVTKSLPHESVGLVELMATSLDNELMQEMPDFGEEVH